MSRTLRVTGNHGKLARLVLLPVSEASKNRTSIFFVQCIIKQLLDSVFVMSRIIKVLVRVISLNFRLRLKSLTSTLIILDITKTSFNDCLMFPLPRLGLEPKPLDYGSSALTMRSPRAHMTYIHFKVPPVGKQKSKLERVQINFVKIRNLLR